MMQITMYQAVLLMTLLITSHASEASEGHKKSPTALEQLLEERDQQIQSLLKRVEALENKESKTPLQASTATIPESPSSRPTPKSLPKKAKENKRLSPSKPSAEQAEGDEAERALERTLVISGASLVPYGQGEVQPGFNYLRYSSQGSALLQQRSAISLASTNSHSDMYIGSAYIRLGLPWESQLESYVPYESINRTDTSVFNSSIVTNANRSANNFGDIRLGLAKTLLTEKSWWPDVIARITWSADTGPTPYMLPLGAGYNELNGSITLSKRQDPLVFFGTASYQAAFSRDNRSPGNTLGFLIGTVMAASPDTSLRFFINQNFLSNAALYGKSIQGTATNISTLNIGASSVLGKGFFLDFTSGVGLTRTSPDYTVGLSFAYRFDLPFLPAL